MASSSPQKSPMEATAIIPTLASPSNPVLDLANEIEKRLYYYKLFSEMGVRLSHSITAAMDQQGIWNTFIEILETEKEMKDASIAKMTIEFGGKRPHPVEEDNEGDDDEQYDDDDSDDTDETEHNEREVTKKIVKKQKTAHMEASTQTINGSPTFFDTNINSQE